MHDPVLEFCAQRDPAQGLNNCDTMLNWIEGWCLGFCRRSNGRKHQRVHVGIWHIHIVPKYIIYSYNDPLG